jgi:hypothetical protein
MSKIHAAESMWHEVLRKQGRCSGQVRVATSPAMRMNSNLDLFFIGHTLGYLDYGLARGRYSFALFLLRTCRAQRVRKRIKPARRGLTTFAISPQSAKIFTEWCKAPAGERSSRRTDAPRFFVPSDLRISETKLRCPQGRDRGME